MLPFLEVKSIVILIDEGRIHFLEKLLVFYTIEALDYIGEAFFFKLLYFIFILLDKYILNIFE